MSVQEPKPQFQTNSPPTKAMVWQSTGFPAKQSQTLKETLVIPDTLKFLLAVAAIAAGVYGTVLALAHFPPEPTDVTRALSHDKLRQN
jgi:hypothetical protein